MPAPSPARPGPSKEQWRSHTGEIRNILASLGGVGLCLCFELPLPGRMALQAPRLRSQPAPHRRFLQEARGKVMLNTKAIRDNLVHYLSVIKPLL